MKHGIRRGLRRAAALFLPLVFLFLSVPGAHAAEAAPPVIRVAFPSQPGLTGIDESGAYSGYTYEYLEEIAQYTGWEYEFVQVPGNPDTQLATLTDMLRAGEIDLMGGLLYTEPLGGALSFSSYSYGTAETVLLSPLASTQIIAINSQQEQVLRVAVRASQDDLVQELNEYCTMNHITPILVPCASNEDLVRAVENGQADVLLHSSLHHFEDMRVIARFSPKPFYFAMAPASAPALLTALNDAIMRITQTDPHFQTALQEKYLFPPSTVLVLTDEEQAFLSSLDTLRVGVAATQPPFQYKNDKTGELQGIGVDLLRHIAETLDLSLTLTEADTPEQVCKLAADGEVDVIAAMPYDYPTARDRGLAMTRPYVTSQYVLLMSSHTSADSLHGKRLALSRSTTYHGYFVGDVTYYDSIDACIHAVRGDLADYTYADAYTAQYYMNLPEFADLSMVPQSHAPRDICFGVHKAEGHMLLGILNKVILTLPEEELQSIVYANTVYQQPFSVGYLIRRYPFQTIFALLCVFLLIFALLITILRQRSKATRDMAFELQKHLRLYSIANDYFFEYDFNKESLIFSIPRQQGDQQAEILRFDARHPVAGPSQESTQTFWDIVRSGENTVREARLYSKDGVWHWVRITLETITDETGTPVFAIGRLTIIDAEKNEQAALRRMAQRDSLTHLYNNETCRDEISRRLAALEPGQTGALLLLDIDYFKDINDTCGHLSGDHALQSVATLLREGFRSNDVIGRPGGDEFIVYMDQIQSPEALSERCAALCAAVRKVQIGGQHALTISAGAALAFPGQDFNTLYQSADQALYAAKNAGRDHFVIAPPSL